MRVLNVQTVYDSVTGQLKELRERGATRLELVDAGEQLSVGWGFVHEPFGRVATAAVYQFCHLRWPGRYGPRDPHLAPGDLSGVSVDAALHRRAT